MPCPPSFDSRDRRKRYRELPLDGGSRHIARMLLARHAPVDAEQAEALLDQVDATASKFGFPILQRLGAVTS